MVGYQAFPEKNIEKNYPAVNRWGELESDCGVLNTEQHEANREAPSTKNFNPIC